MQTEQPSRPPAAADDDGPEPADPADAAPLTNLADLLRARAAEAPDAVALVQPAPERAVFTWSALDARVDAVAGGLNARGLLAGQRLALLGAGSATFVVAHLAALRAGVVVVPVNPQSTVDEVAVMVADSGARALLTDAPALTPAGVQALPLSTEGLDELAASGSAPVASPRDAETLAVLLYTAGTSGRPKAAMLTHRALLAHVAHLRRLGVPDRDDTVLALLPLFHVFGLNAVLGSWLGAGARLVVLDGYPEEGLAALVQAEQVTNLPLAPPTLHRLLAEDDLEDRLATLTTVVSGAAPLPEELGRRFRERTGLEVQQGYGLTEAAPGVTATFGSTRTGPGHVGRPLPGVELRIGDGSEPTEPGEVAIRGDNLFSGYWPDGADGPDAAGWFRTGDIGYLEDGELFLVDRARELVIVNGFNVYPAEVEQVILELDEVDAVAVVGRPDARTGEQVVACVQGRDATPDLVVEHCERRLARFKRPAEVAVLDELPRGATGKIRKGELRALVTPEREPA